MAAAAASQATCQTGGFLVKKIYTDEAAVQEALGRAVMEIWNR
jgi:hypothetical protein